MIGIVNNPPRSQWSMLTSRSAIGSVKIDNKVESIVDDVASRGDEAIRELTLKIDGVELTEIELPQDAECNIDDKLKEAIELASRNIRTFHSAQLTQPVDIQTMPGVRCVQRSIPIERVGLYIPGGTAPLFSTVLMLAIPAVVAGCSQIVLCSPPPISPAIIYAARKCGVNKIFQVGGAMAIAAMAHGTDSIPKVDKIFGPGNQWVTTAKQLVSRSHVAIDMPAGPSEVMILADNTARAEYVAADMLSQAEHGVDSQAIAVCQTQAFAQNVAIEVEKQLENLSRAEISKAALANCRIIVISERSEMIEFANLYAAEHLIISMDKPWDVASEITAAGSVFIGNYSPESVGDYASGTNHTLPTYGWARSYSGVNIDSFMHKITYQELNRSGLDTISDSVVIMAENEGLTAHANAVKIRIKQCNKV